MKKVALVFVLAVLVPSLVLAWLAVRSLRDQQFLLERQQSLIDQHTTDALALNIAEYLAQQQQEFSAQVESMAAAGNAQTLAAKFDDQLRQRWPLAEVGFCVTTAGKILSPLPNARPAAQMFRLDNSSFLGNREPVEVYLTANNANGNNFGANSIVPNTLNFSRNQAGQSALDLDANSAAQVLQPQRPQQSIIAEPSGGPNSSTPLQPTIASATSTGSAGGGGGGGLGAADNRTRNMPAPTTSAADNASAKPSFAGTAGLNQKSSPTRNQANQMSFSINNSRAGPAAAGQMSLAQQGQSLKSPVQSDGRNPAPPSQAFAINGGADGGGTKNFFDDAASAPAGAPPRAVVADSMPTAPQEKLAPAMAKELNTLEPAAAVPPQQAVNLDDSAAPKDVVQSPYQNNLNYKSAQSRKVSPQSQAYQNPSKSKADSADDEQNNLSRVVPAEAEFRQLIGQQTDGMLARFLQNKLKLMCWHRLSSEPDLIFGAQLNLDRVVSGLRGLVQSNRSGSNDICLVVLDDNAKPVVLSRDKFQANWKRPFVATEVGDALPHWEVAAYLVNPAQFTQAARTAKLALGLLIAVLVVAIGIGSLLIVRSLNLELKLARQKTDFVSNVSHELKTPLTSIRMFSELLADGRVTDQAKQHSYLQIITAEAGRLTRLINNVLDFSRMESGEKKYNFQPCDLAGIVRGTAETFRPHLEASGFKFICDELPVAVAIRGDSDALSQVIVNLLSNAEKYSNGGKEISLQLEQKQSPLPHAEIRVLDRGPGVPRGSEEKIFEKFYRAHDSLSSGVQGSGLGLTIARQIARAHGGDVVYEPREGGGSCFILRLPVQTT